MTFFLFVIGAIVGSFMNVCIYRLPREKSIIKPRSFCPLCKEAIPWYDNIPMVSFLLLRGRCRFCKGKISPVYIIVEIISGSMCVLLFRYFGFTPRFFILWYLTCSLIVASFIDLRFQEIPDVITLPGILIGLGAALFYPPLMARVEMLPSALQSFLGVLAGGGSIYALGFVGEIIFKKEAMGGGDVKLLAMVGAFLGWKLAIFVFFLAPFFGAVVGITLKIKEGRDIIPYGPYLSLAAIVAVFYGEAILKRLFFI